MIKELWDICLPPKALPVPDGVCVKERWDPPMDVPQSRREALRVYGNPGAGKVDPKWERENMTLVRNLPGPRPKLYIHKLAEPFLREALARAVENGTADYIERMGCFNFRHQRHDIRRPLSYHSFGVAVDINPRSNKAVYSPAESPLPAPWTTGWWEVWPNGVPQGFVEAFESVGWTWGGRWNNFKDGMHFQLVR